MCINANAVVRSWTLLAAFGGSYAPVPTQLQNTHYFTPSGDTFMYCITIVCGGLKPTYAYRCYRTASHPIDHFLTHYNTAGLW